MRILPILAFTCLFGSISFAQGQSRTPSRPEPAQPAANVPASDTVDKSLPPAAVNGIPVRSEGAHVSSFSHLHAY